MPQNKEVRQQKDGVGDSPSFCKIFNTFSRRLLSFAICSTVAVSLSLSLWLCMLLHCETPPTTDRTNFLCSSFSLVEPSFGLDDSNEEKRSRIALCRLSTALKRERTSSSACERQNARNKKRRLGVPSTNGSRSTVRCLPFKRGQVRGKGNIKRI